MPPRLLAALSLVAAMALTGANVAFGKAIAAAIPVYIFVLFRFVVASLALAPMARGEPGPKLVADEPARMARPGADGAARHGRLHGADAGGAQAHGRGRCRHHHGDPARRGGGAGRAVRRRPPVAPAGARRGAWPSPACCWCRPRARRAAARRWSATCWWRGPCCARRASSSSASGWRRPTGRCGWRSAPTWPAWCWRSRSLSSTRPPSIRAP